MSCPVKPSKEQEKETIYSKSWWSDWYKRSTDGETTPARKGRRFPWVAAGGLTLLVSASLAVLWLAIYAVTYSVYRFGSVLFFILTLPFRAVGMGGSIILWLPLKILFALIPIWSSHPPGSEISNGLHCNNTLELQGWEALTFVPGRDGNPNVINYQLNSPTPHAVSFIDIDYRDTRLDVFSNGKYYGSTSDFTLDKSVYCGEDLNDCIQQGFSMGTIVIPAGKQSVDVVWSGKDVFPGTDKILWGSDRKRRVMWKKEICL